MRKVLLNTTTVILLGLLGASMAQKVAAANSYGGTTGESATASLGHHVYVHIPTVVILQLNGTSGNYAVDFQPTASEMEAAAAGTLSSLPTPDASSGFVSLKGFTNSPSNVDVTVGISPDTTPTGYQTVEDDIMIGTGYVNRARGTAPALAIPGFASTLSNPKPGWTTLIDSSTNPFQLALQGTEAPGDYSFTITYSATVP